MKKDKTVSKSIRLDTDFVDFVEAQEGRNFTNKLSGILEEYIKGDEKRKANIRYYEKMINSRRRELTDYIELRQALSNIQRNAYMIESKLEACLVALEEYEAKKEEAAYDERCI